MPLINIGDQIPAATFKILGNQGPEDISTDAIFDSRKIILFGLPGAFTPTCHLNHLPGYLDQLDTLKSKGIDDVAVVSVNDVWTMDAWAKATKGKGKLLYLADGSAEFAKSIGLDIDLSDKGMGIRSMRYSVLVVDGEVVLLNIEEMPGQAITSGVAEMLKQMKSIGY